MRALVLSVLLLVITLPALGQDSAGEPFYSVTQTLDHPAETVEQEIRAMASANDWLDGPQGYEERGPFLQGAGNPTALIAGDVFLRIDGHPLTLYIQATNGHTELTVECRHLYPSPEARRTAEALMQRLTNQFGVRNG